MFHYLLKRSCLFGSRSSQSNSQTFDLCELTCGTWHLWCRHCRCKIRHCLCKIRHVLCSTSACLWHCPTSPWVGMHGLFTGGTCARPATTNFVVPLQTSSDSLGRHYVRWPCMEALVIVLIVCCCFRWFNYIYSSWFIIHHQVWLYWAPSSNLANCVIFRFFIKNQHFVTWMGTLSNIY